MKSARAKPGGSAALVQRAAALQSAGQANEAAQLLSQAVNQFPAEPEPWLRLGNLLAGAGQWATAERCYAARCRLKPAAAQPFYNWGVTLVELGRVPEAVSAYERALALQPGDAAAHHALALAHLQLQAFDAALQALDRAIALMPKEGAYIIERARVRLRMGQCAAALADLEAVPPSADALNLKGIALRQLHRAADALAAYDEALKLNPQFVEALNNRGNLRLLARRFSPALDDFEHALALKPDSDWLAGLRLYAAMHIYQWQGLDEQLAMLRQAVAQGQKVIQPLALQCLLDDPVAQQQAARTWAQHSFPPKAEWAPSVASSHEPSDRIRIAYLSRDFRSHPVSFLMAEIIELHDRAQFEVIALNYGAASDDAMQQRLRAAFDQFHDVERLPDAQIADLARRLGVDIAVDVTGLTDGARTGILSWRAAPVQMQYLGTLGTAGSPVIDYLLADATLIPAEARDAYDERVVYLPSYQANDRRRPRPEPTPRDALGLPADAFVFACFNNPCKLNPAMFAMWAEILRAVPRGVLWVLEEDEQARVNLCAHAQALGLDPQRLHFAKRTGREAYLAGLAAADLFLDTLPYNAGTTASDALWMGLPVLTLQGRSFPARMAASLLNAVGLPELVTKSAADYVATAKRLAQQPDELRAIRQRLLAARDGSALFDTPRFTRHLESAYLEAHQLRLAGEAPRDIVVSGGGQG
ncbi:tetratricopeptide repeat protein [Roseateles asaccharophilus]|uniref:protein O-GlcNAc transferase n=1 Tax=Roseateles asaccharophilus TaxID=582607 RepID=A0ABU2ACQ7_9BURK|nr:tetratricopeptide repeat protein [Roseateles asaccharophilus]MDR7334987.1 putative O-linked N-acetylglucosamine transferase (SPINDLY family) [Roseateles asaccharophilus]